MNFLNKLNNFPPNTWCNIQKKQNIQHDSVIGSEYRKTWASMNE